MFIARRGIFFILRCDRFSRSFWAVPWILILFVIAVYRAENLSNSLAYRRSDTDLMTPFPVRWKRLVRKLIKWYGLPSHPLGPIMAAKSNEAKKRLTLAEAAKVLGVTEAFVLGLTLTGARRPTEQGESVVEIEYEMNGDDAEFTPKSIERFLKACPLGDLITAAKAAEFLSVHRSHVAMLQYTGVATLSGTAVKLPVWQIGGGEYVSRKELEEFAVHHKAAAERRAAREHAKKYQNRGSRTIKL